MIGFFEEKQGVKSSTRLSSFLLLVFYFVFSYVYIFIGNKIDGNYTIFTFVILVAVFYPKYLHKLAELKDAHNQKNE